jgi:Skp family chaperone for outer membrane proteins
VAIIDLQRVAEETGYSRQLSSQLDGLRTDLQGSLAKVQEQLNAKLTEKQDEFGEKPSDEQKQELNALFADARQRLQSAQQQALGIVERQRSNMVNQIYELVRPHAKRVASDRQFDIVMLKSDTLVFDHAPDTDITDEVISELIRAQADQTLIKPAAKVESTPAADETQGGADREAG